MTNTAAASQSKFSTVLRVTSGNFMEMFDFFLFGFYATHISKTFFPGGDEFASLMLTFMTFGAGFLMRPLGAIFLGAYVDRVGRRAGLIVTLMLMALGTMLIAFVPGFATIGYAAPFLVLVGRLLQGFSAGVELGGVSVYLSEMATPGHKGFYVSWQSASQQVAIIVAAARPPRGCFVGIDEVESGFGGYPLTNLDRHAKPPFGIGSWSLFLIAAEFARVGRSAVAPHVESPMRRVVYIRHSPDGPVIEAMIGR